MNTGDAVVEHPSPVGFEQTLERLTKAIERAGMTIFARIDHAAGARDVGLAMPPTVVLIYGNPRGGTPIMAVAPVAALDLPLRVLIREDADGRTSIAFHRIASVLTAAGVPSDLAHALDPAQDVVLEQVRA